MAEVATKQLEADDEELPITRVLSAVSRVLARLVRALVIPAILLVVLLTLMNQGSREATGGFLRSHLGFVFWGLLLVGFGVWRAWEAKQRHKVIFAPRTTKRSTEKPLMRSMSKAFSDSVDILLFRDEKPWRVAYLLMTAGASALSTINAWGPKDWPFSLARGDQSGTPATAILATIGPLVWFIVVLTRLNKIFGQRSAVIEGIHGVAKTTLKYPKPGARMSPEDRRLSAAYTAVEVKEWETLTMPRRFFVLAPTTLTVTDGKSWSEFEANLGARVPHPEGWHVERDRNGRGALIAPAQYPLGVLWDGEQDPDPLTFLLGANLDDPETPLSITFGEVSPHALVTGGTGSGKTSLAEAIMAQAATKAMPWDPTLFATCHVIDPKGPFANRWFGRPNMDVTNGTRDIEMEGESNSGVVAMAFHMERVFADMNARQAILDQYTNLATWMHLPDAEKVANRMAPVFIVMDEFLDHTGKDPGTSEAVMKDNAARERLMYITGIIARKGRSLGFHLILIAQDAKMTDIGSSLIRQLAARAVMGNMDIHANARMFGNDVTIPLLPASRIVNGKEKTIPGRTRLMNAPGQVIHRAQVYWFGGSDNSQTLDKYLPRALDEAAPVSSDTENTAVSSELIDANNNGIPDQWEVAGAAVEALNAQADKAPHKQAPQHAWATTAEAFVDEPALPAPSAPRATAAPPGFPSDAVSTSAPDDDDDDPFGDGFSLDDLDEIAAEAALGADEQDEPAPAGGAETAPSGEQASWMPQRRARATTAPSADGASTHVPIASESTADPDDEPIDKLPADPFEDGDESAMRIVGPAVTDPYKPLAASESDVVDPGDFMGRRV